MKYPRIMMSAIIAAFAVVATSPLAVQAQSEHGQVVVALPDGLEWGPAPDILPRGAQAVVIEGDPSQEGEFTLRLRMPSGYVIPPHYHPTTEHVTVLQGTFYVGMGGKFDESQVNGLPTGAFGAIPPGMQHYALTREEVIIQLHGNGPWRLIYVNPEDRPSTR